MSSDMELSVARAQSFYVDGQCLQPRGDNATWFL